MNKVLRTRPRFGKLLLIIGVAFCSALLMMSCTKHQPTAEELDQSLRVNLPPGTPKEQIGEFLSVRGISYSDAGQQLLLDGPNGSLHYRTIRAAVNVDSVLFENAKIIIEFYLDDDNRLVELKVRQTSLIP